MNVKNAGVMHKCTSCQMCAAVCPKNAINIALDRDGFYRPNINDKLCIDCGICTKVCYKFEPKKEEFGPDKLERTTLYGATALDANVVKNTTSGGIADLLAHELLKEGFKCVGAVYDSGSDNCIDKVAIAETDLISFRGSKYIQSYTVDAFKELVENCKNDKYAVFGTPCHIYALDKFLRLRNVRDRHVLIDLYCHGCPSMNLWQKYIRNIKSKIGYGKIDSVNFRSKVKGWGNFYVVVVVVDGKPVHYSSPGHNEFYDLFFCNHILNEACNDCSLRGTLAYTDIRLGDFWGKQYALNSKGVSAVSLVSNKAKALFDKIAADVTYKEERYEDFLPWQSWGKAYHPNPEMRLLLFEQLRDEKLPLQNSIDTIHHRQNLLYRLSHICKSIINSLPIMVEKCIRWVYYRIR